MPSSVAGGFPDSTPITRIFTATSSKTVGNTTAETSIIPAGVGTLIVPGGFIQAGSIFTLVARGTYSTGLVSGLLGTLTIRAKLGTTTMGQAVIQMNTFLPSATGKGWESIGSTVFRTTGSNATANTSGTIRYIGGPGNAGTEEFVNNTVTVDLTTHKPLDVTAQFSNASASNSITVTQLYFSYTPPPA